MSPRVIHGDMRTELEALRHEAVRVHSIVTDPPYGLAFMGKHWDAADNIAFQYETWRLCFDLLPPGGHLLACAGTRTYHRMACAIEEAGFEIRDTICWLYGSGFPKSHNVSKGIDKAAGAEREVVGVHRRHGGGRHAPVPDSSGEAFNLCRLGPSSELPLTAAATDAARQWDGWGTALKPAMELICVARKPLRGTVAANVLEFGTGALNIGGCRIEAAETLGRLNHTTSKFIDSANGSRDAHPRTILVDNSGDKGRWPANVVHDGSAEVVKAFPESASTPRTPSENHHTGRVTTFQRGSETSPYFDEGSAARFFYSSKADADDRLGSKHPTVKPVDLMRWLVRLVTPPGGTVLDPFAGSGTTGMACMAEGFDCILVEREAEYVADIKARIAHVRGDDTPLFAVAAE